MYTIRFRCVDVEMRDNENFNFQCKKRENTLNAVRACVCVVALCVFGEVAGFVTQLK